MSSWILAVIGGALIGIAAALLLFALTNVPTGASEVLLFVAAMIAGFLLHRVVARGTRPGNDVGAAEATAR